MKDGKAYLKQEEMFFWDKWKSKPEKEKWIFEFYLGMARVVYPWYQEKGWEEIFYATFFDITLWALDYYEKTQQVGLKEVGWIEKILDKKVFRLGRLEFETSEWEEEDCPQYGLKNGRPLLHIHIPAGERLEMTACLASIEEAKQFFGEEWNVMICDSWLLDPSLQEILKENSNILKFQSLFHVWKVHYDTPQAEERIYGEVKEKKEEYLEHTTLQKQCKSYLLSGKRFGMGIGILKEEQSFFNSLNNEIQT